MSDLHSVASSVQVSSANKEYTIQSAGSFNGELRSFNGGQLGTKANGPDGFTNAKADSIYSDDISAVSGGQCCKCQIKEDDRGINTWGGVFNIDDVHDGEEFWWQTNVFHPNGFSFENTGQGIKHMRLHQFKGNGDHQWYIDYLMRGNSGATCALEGPDFPSEFITSGPEPRGVGPAIQTGRWNKYEVYVKARSDNTGIIRWWNNNELIFEATNGPTLSSPTNYYGNLLFLTYWNDHGAANNCTYNNPGPTDTCGSPKDQHLYIDEFRWTKSTPGNTDANGNRFIGEQ